MTDPLKRVFISYRREASKYPALLVYKSLSQAGYDVFIDYESIDSGKFAKTILNQIASRSHFIVILSPGSLDRTRNPEDWLRKEIEFAIDNERSIVPLLFDGFTIEAAKPYLTGKLSVLSEYNALRVYDGYFDEAMEKIRSRFLKKPDGVIQSVPESDNSFVQKAIQDADIAAAQAVGEGAVVKYLEKNLTPQAMPSKPASIQDVLGTYPMQGETILLNETVSLPPSLSKSISAASGMLMAGPSRALESKSGRLILTNKRLLIRRNEDNFLVFEISRLQLKFAKISYIKITSDDGMNVVETVLATRHDIYQFNIESFSGQRGSARMERKMMLKLHGFIPGEIVENP